MDRAGVKIGPYGDSVFHLVGKFGGYMDEYIHKMWMKARENIIKALN